MHWSQLPLQVLSDVQSAMCGDILLAGQVAYYFALTQRNQRTFIMLEN
jgi:hypothetical protein